MATYTIKEVENITGIKAHSLRVWEQRYCLLKPNRTKTNIRFYTEEDLKFLLNVSLLLKNGEKISKIARLSAVEVQTKAAQFVNLNKNIDEQLDALVLAMIDLDQERFSTILDIHIEQDGFKQTFKEVISPFLERLSLFWMSGTIKPVHERFMTYILEEKLTVACSQLPQADAKAPLALLYLAVGETHELTLMMAKYFFKRYGFNILYLGIRNDMQDLATLACAQKPDYIFTVLSESFISTSPVEYLTELKTIFPTSKIYVTGFLTIASNFQASNNLKILDGLQELVQLLEKEVAP